MRKPVVKMRSRGDCHLGEIEVPMTGGTIRVQTLGWDPSAALRRAGSAMLQIATDPAIAPFLPPQVTLVAQTARALSRMTPAELKEAAREGQPAERKIAKALLRKLRDQRQREIDEEQGVSGPLTVLKRLVTGRSPSGGGSGKRSQTRTSQPRPRPMRQMGPVKGSRGQTIITNATPENPPPGFWWNVDHWERLPADASMAPPGAVPGFGPGGADPRDVYAMQAWGASAFDQPSELQPDIQADAYFEAYEDINYDDFESDRVPGYEPEVYPTQDADADANAEQESDEMAEE